ncbi:MAG: DUF222 domain-containing protein [Frankiales bacterium]|nr:DUF222 domain-containing protein [Frankiales bacterium]
MSLVLSAPVADLVVAVDKMCAEDPVITEPLMLLGDIEAVQEVITKLQALVVRRVRAADAIDAPSELMGRSTRAWLHEDLTLAGPAASRIVRLSRELSDHPATAEAFNAGVITDAHATAILTSLRALPPDLRDTVEPHLIDRARLNPPEEIAGFTDELVQGLGIDKASDITREKRLTERGVDLRRTLDGATVISGTLTPEVAARFDAALTAAAQPAGPGDDRTPRQRRHDALGTLADTYLTAASGGAPSFTGAPRTVIVTMDLAVLEGQLRDALVMLPSGATISADTARRLACDAELIPAVLGGRSEVLDIGQADHEFTAAIRRAAYLRDGGRCAFPRCRNRVSELHHIRFRRHGGATSLENAAWLCNHHHWLAHDGGWTLGRIPRGYRWTSPAGRCRERHLDDEEPIRYPLRV